MRLSAKAVASRSSKLRLGRQMGNDERLACSLHLFDGGLCRSRISGRMNEYYAHLHPLAHEGDLKNVALEWRIAVTNTVVLKALDSRAF